MKILIGCLIVIVACFFVAFSNYVDAGWNLKDAMYWVAVNSLEVTFVFTLSWLILQHTQSKLIAFTIKAFLCGIVFLETLQYLSIFVSKAPISVLALENLTEGRYINISNSMLLVMLIAIIPFYCIVSYDGRQANLIIRRLLAVQFLILAILSSVCWIKFKSTGGYNWIPSQMNLMSLMENASKAYHNYKCLNEYCDNPSDLKDFGRNHLYINSNVSMISCDNRKLNIFVLFVEGFSSRYIDYYDPVYGRLMPNMYFLRKNSTSFRNYFNHTAATYRGVKGQLTSGYPEMGGSNEGQGWENKNSANKLSKIKNKSLVDFANNENYNTAFFVPLSDVHPFIKLIRSLGFSEVYTANVLVNYNKFNDRKFDLNDINTFQTDSEFFNSISNYILKNKLQSPFFVTAYNTGTHVFLDTYPDEKKFGTGINKALNRFHNFDYAFGVFYKKFREDYPEDKTVFIVTTDHAPYPDADHKKVFDNKYFVDEIPLIISGGCNGKPNLLDSGGRTSVDFAPTVAEILQFNPKQRNGFLGESLYGKRSNVSNISAINDVFYFIYNNKVYSVPDIPFDQLRQFDFAKVYIQEYYKSERSGVVFK